MLNPGYSLFTDTSAYFLTWDNGATPERFANQANNLSGVPAKEPFFMYEEKNIFGTRFHGGHPISPSPPYIYESRFQEGEGFAKGFGGKSQKISIEPKFAFTSGPNAIVHARMASWIGAHQLRISVNGNAQLTENFNNAVMKQYNMSIPATTVTSPMEVLFEGLNTGDDRVVISQVNITYPRQFDFDNASFFEFNIEASGNVKYLEIENFNHGGVAPILYDLTNNFRMVTTLNGNTVRIALPASSSMRKLVLQAIATYKSASNITKRNFTDFGAANAAFVLISHQKFITPAGPKYLQEYSDFRAANGLTSMIVDINELYDQFAYGIDRHNIAINNFIQFANRNWSEAKYVFLVGKGRSYDALRTTTAAQNFYVPSFGWPASDNLASAPPGSGTPTLGIGRIAITENSQLGAYLDKIKAYTANQTNPQTIAGKEWMRRIIHLGGGDPGIQSTIRNSLNRFKDVVEVEKYGADVTSFFKTSSSVIQQSQSELLTDLINTGTSMVSFFGHASANSFDYNLDNPANYENKDRYFTLFSLGCYTGLIHNKNPGLSEEFVLTPDKGAIAFLSPATLSGLGNLDRFGQDFYTSFGREKYGEGMGSIIKHTIAKTDGLGSVNQDVINQSMTYHGDPAINLNAHQGPDYIPDLETVSFNPSVITAQLDTFAMTFDVVNIGSADIDSMFIRITHEQPDGAIIPVFEQYLPAPFYRTTYTAEIPITDPDKLVGLNLFNIRVDVNDDIAEMPAPNAELNNDLTKIPLYILAQDITPAFPETFSIHTEGTLELKSFTTNLFAKTAVYHWQIDTTEYFNSPLLETTSMQVPGGELTWNPSIPLIDSTVYYWRVSIDSTSTVGFNWKTSSFVHLGGSTPGWNQSHFFQFKKDNFNDILLEEPNRDFEYISNFKEVTVQNGNWPILTKEEKAFFINANLVYSEKYCSYPGIYFAVFDPVSIDIWDNYKVSGSNVGRFGSIHCKDQNYPVFMFRTNSQAWRKKAIDFLRDSIPNNHYVLTWSLDEYRPDQWEGDLGALGTTLFDELENLGMSNIRSVGNTPLPFIGFYQKGNAAFPNSGQNYATSTDSVIRSSFLIPGLWDSGEVISTDIGPASKWTSLHWQKSALDNIATDAFAVDVIGLSKTGAATMLAHNVQAQDTSLASIDASQYPKLRLVYRTSDPLTRTCPQLDFWRVHYTPLPDAALRPDLHFVLDSDTLQQGQDLHLEIDIANVNGIDMDSMLMRYTVIDQQNNQTVVTERYDKLSANGTLRTSLDINTRAYQKVNQLVIEANPDDDQPELYHFNNIAVTKFYIRGDELNPLLDVTFDGLHIMDGDLVSANPEIVIALNDENKFLELSDTSIFKVFLQHPNDDALTEIHFDDPRLTWYPANPAQLGTKNEFIIEFNPMLEEDGIYNLIVQAEDMAGNESGSLDYKVAFEVRNETSISHVLNYPNPFSTRTHFVYTLTGSTPPEYFKIQIMTVSGQIVREINQDEMGPLKVGTHKTDYTWDGTDEYGDKLANGVYVYRMVALDSQQQELKRYDTVANQYFKKGFGKMVILR